MKYGITMAILLGCGFLTSRTHAQTDLKSYPVDAERFLVSARDLLQPLELQTMGYAQAAFEPAEAAQRIRQACLFLEAAVTLDPRNVDAWRELYPLYMTDIINDAGRVAQALDRYTVLNPQDNQTLELWIPWQMQYLQDRSSREEFLKKAQAAAARFPITQSRILTQLGIMAVEKGAYEGADSANSYFNQALKVWPDNDDALFQLLQLPVKTTEEADKTNPEKEQQRIRLQQILRWRILVHHNPYNLSALLQVIDALEQFNYHELAAGYYPYALNLAPLAANQPLLESEIRLKQIVNSYSLGKYQLCVSQAEQALNKNPDDIVLSGIYIRAMENAGSPETARKQREKTTEVLLTKIVSPQIPPDSRFFLEAAWYFCFIDPQYDRALSLVSSIPMNAANPQPRAQALLAYLYVLTGKIEPAQAALTLASPDDPLCVLAKAKIELLRNDAQAAHKTLGGVPKHKQALLDQEFRLVKEEIQAALGPNVPPEEPLPDSAKTEQKQIADILQNSFADKELTLPLHPDQFLNGSLRLDKDIFYYNDPIFARADLTNVGETNLLLGPSYVLDPHVVIFAHAVRLSSASSLETGSEIGTVQVFPVAYVYLRQSQMLRPTQANSARLCLNLGSLHKLLQVHPYWNYRITFHMYIDPVPDGQGGWISRIAAIQPQPATVFRPGIRPTQKNLEILIGDLNQKNTDNASRSALILAGLLRQQSTDVQTLPQEKQILFPPEKIRDALISNFHHPDFRARAWTAFAFQSQALSVIAPVINQMVPLLKDPEWLVRFMAICTLDQYADLSEYWQWAEANEMDPLVMRMIQWKQNKSWRPLSLTQEMPSNPDAGLPKTAP